MNRLKIERILFDCVALMEIPVIIALWVKGYNVRVLAICFFPAFLALGFIAMWSEQRNSRSSNRTNKDYVYVKTKILQYLYSCLTDGETSQYFEIFDILENLPKQYAAYILKNLHSHGYLEEMYPKNFNMQLLSEEELAGECLTLYSTITPKGIDYLHRKEHVFERRNPVEALDRVDAQIEALTQQISGISRSNDNNCDFNDAKWHNLQRKPMDLPEKSGTYLVVAGFDRFRWMYEILQYDAKYREWKANLKVIKWMEIPLTGEIFLDEEESQMVERYKKKGMSEEEIRKYFQLKENVKI